MKVTVTTSSDSIFTLEVSEDMELENFKALCEFELGIPSQELVIVWSGRPLQDDKKTLKDYGIQDNDVLLAQHVLGALGGGSRGQAPMNTGHRQGAATGGMPMIDFGSIQIPGASGSQPRPRQPPPGNRMPDDPAVIREMLLSRPDEIALLKERNPPLANALLSGSVETFTQVLEQQKRERMEKERERIAMLNADPFDAAVQKKIAEEIRLQNVDQNMETAMEYSPESFGQVVMLYIDCTVNGHHVKAFVDSGAQMTIMSQACAERCNIMRLVDTRWAGIAKGVGTQKIIGRVHLGQIQIGKDFLQSSFSILEEQPMDMLLGLDMLKRHQCCIDLKRNVLVIGTTGTETTFLAESELPEYARLNRQLSAGSEQELGDRQLAEALAKSAQEAAGPSGTSSSAPRASNFPEENITTITNSGFSRQQAIEELQKANGDTNQALLSLLAKSIQFPKN